MRKELFIFACALMPLSAVTKKSLPKPPVDWQHLVQTGTASWYGNECKGMKTASGARYDPEQLTAAHRNLPFGTLVKVTNLRNNHSVTVKITNRGPFARHRIIDVSRAAARKLEMIHSGVAHVRIEVVEKPGA